MRPTRSHLHTLALAAAVLATSSAPPGAAWAQDKKRDIAAIENDLVADDPAVRAKAAAELADRFPDGAVAVPMLVDLLDDESPEVVTAAVATINSLTVAAAGPLLSHLSEDVDWSAGTRDGEVSFDVLVRAGGGHGARADLIFDLAVIQAGKGPRPSELIVAALLPPSARPWLIEAIRSPDATTRTLAATALVMSGAESIQRTTVRSCPAADPRVVTTAIALANHKDPARSWAGTRVLELLRSADPAVLSALTRVVLEPPPVPLSLASSRRQTAVMALARIGRPAAAAAPALLDCLARDHRVPATTDDEEEDEDDYQETRPEYAFALTCIGHEAAVEKLLEARSTCAEILADGLDAGRLAPNKVVPLAIREVEASAKPNRAALSLLSKYGPAASAALPLLTKRLRAAQDPETTYAYAQTVVSISPTDRDAIEALDARIGHGELIDYLIAQHRIVVAPKTLARLQDVLARADSNGDMAARSPFVLWLLQPSGDAAKGSVRDLLRLLNGQEKRYADVSARPEAAFGRANLVQTLGSIGPGAAAAIPALTVLRDKGDETIRVPAAQALRRIQAKK